MHCPHVNHEIALLSEFLRTLQAHMRLLPGVQPSMPLQVRILPESLSADIATIGALVLVRAHVPRATPARCKDLQTDLASQLRLLPGVLQDPHLFSEAIACRFL